VNRRHFLISSVASAVLTGAQKNQPVQRSNILIVMADGLGAWMLGCYGNKEIQTPNIDGVARGGLRFTNSFSTSSASAPSRATFLTGRVPRQHGIEDSLDTPAWFASEAMISDVLANAGYNCGYIGKWDLASDRQPRHGYKYTYTVPGTASAYMDPEMSLNGEAVGEKGYLGDLLTQRASEFLDRQSPAQPFFLTVAFPNPRPPYAGHPQKYYDMYAETPFNTIGWERSAPNAVRDKEMLGDIVPNLRRAAASISALDGQIPALLRKLQERKLWDNTLIVITSTTGALLGRHGLWSDGHASDPPNMYDEVVRTPLILSWPGKIPTGEIAPEVVSSYDVLPTLCEAAAVAQPTGRNLAGRSFLAIAKRDPLPKKEPWRNLAFAQLKNTWMARDARYKLVWRNDGAGPKRTVRSRGRSTREVEPL
jgi:arylsulfatase A-like enzyme